MFFFQHNITKLVCDSSLIIAGWLSARFCVFLFFVLGSQGLKPLVCIVNQRPFPPWCEMSCF